MALGRLWAGRAYGTNTGNLAVTLEDDGGALRGTLRFLDQQFGVAVYAIEGTFDGSHLKLHGLPESHAEGLVATPLTATANLNGRGILNGEWQTESGTGGTFTLYPHDQLPDPAPGKSSESPAQLYSARADFPPVSMTLQQLLLLADEVQQQFKRPVIVTVRAGTEVARSLADMKQMRFSGARADFAKLFVQEPDENGLNRTVIVEFGPFYNNAMVQGTDEAWALGQLERIKRSVRPLERKLALLFKQYGVFNALLIFAAVAYLPSLPNFTSRLVLIAGTLVAGYANAWLQARLMPHASILLSEKTSASARFGASIASALVSLVVAIAATILAGLLQGWFQLPK